jgi:alkanesulfonate monooxygenase
MSERPEPVFHWFIPIDGDGEHLGTRRAERPPSFAYLREVVRAAEESGYTGMLIPTRFSNGLFEERAPIAETWTMATALAAVSSRIRFLVAVRPGFIQTGLFAQMVATASEVSSGRIDLNVVPGGIQGDMERLGETAGHDDRYARATEFIDACRALWTAAGPVDFAGEYVQLRGALCEPKPATLPRIYTGGASERALRMAGTHSDVLLAWIEPLAQMEAQLARAYEQFAAAGREPCFGLRAHIVLGESEAAAWAATDALLAQVDPEVERQRAGAIAGTAMVGARSQAAVAGDYRPAPRLWNGISRVRVNCGTAIVGTPQQVADELLEYWKLGFAEFILSGWPHAEEARRVAREVLPLLRERVAALR